MRQDIDPVAVSALLPNLFILETESGQLARFRLAGTALCMLKGRELRGTTLRALMDAAACARAERATELVTAAQQPLLIEATAMTTRGDRVGIEMVMLPVASAAGRIDRIFGSIACLGPARTLEEQIGPLVIDNIICLARDGEIDHAPSHERQDSPVIATRVAAESSPFGSAIRRILQFRVFEGGKS